MDAAAFDARYVAEGDPWGYHTSDYERAKYAATLAACGPGPFGSALELGASIGVFSTQLAPRCEQLTTIDFSPVAVQAARRELSGFPHAEALVGEIPGAIDGRPRHLVVASEILYYLQPAALATTLVELEQRLVRGGRLVVVHWRPPGPERPFSAAEVHGRVCAQPGLEVREDCSGEDYLLHVLERV
jgi:hypothetical protein